MALDKFVLCPLRDSYNIQLGDDVITTQFESGMPRQRLNGVGQPHQVSVTFRHKGQHQDYFYYFWMLHRTKPFAMKLIAGNSQLAWYECRFIGSPGHSDLGNNVHEVSIGILVRPKRLNIELAETYIWAYIQSGGDISTFSNALEKLVNEDLPSALGSLNA